MFRTVILDSRYQEMKKDTAAFKNDIQSIWNRKNAGCLIETPNCCGKLAMIFCCLTFWDRHCKPGAQEAEIMNTYLRDTMPNLNTKQLLVDSLVVLLKNPTVSFVRPSLVKIQNEIQANMPPNTIPTPT
jgi:hypothetical protein